MPFESIVAHRLTRQAPTSPVELAKSDELWPITGKTEDCVRLLKQAWLKRGGKLYGRFNNDIGANPVPAWLQNWQDQSMGFLKLSGQWLEHAKTLLAQTECVLDAYCVCAHERLEAGEYVWFFVTYHEPAFAIDGELSLGDSYYLETNRFMLACKIALNDWKADENQQYVAMARAPGEPDLTEWFEAAVGFTDKLDTAKQTADLLWVVDDYAKQLPGEVASQTRDAVVNYCLDQSKAGESVSLENLQKQLPEENLPSLAQFAEQHEAKPDKELMPHAGQIRQYVRISGRNEQMSMSFSSDCLGGSVVYDAAADSLVIKNIPASLKSRLLKHLKS